MKYYELCIYFATMLAAFICGAIGFGANINFNPNTTKEQCEQRLPRDEECYQVWVHHMWVEDSYKEGLLNATTNTTSN